MHKQKTLTVSLGIDGRPLDARLIAMLRALGEHGSLAGAARKAGLSYRHAWGELGRITEVLGGTIVELQRGRGATLTPAGSAWLTLHQALEVTLAAGSPALTKALTPTQLVKTTAKPPALRIHASHDFALALLRDIAIARKLPIALHSLGSLDALQALADDKCDVAGFHVAIEPPAAVGLGPLAPLLRRRSIRLIEFATRRQGLMVKRGKAPQICKLAELTRRGVRFVNRQPGSGTRILFDRLLAAEGIAIENIHGYRDEEFTHAAVAATVASGKAHAGFGIEAAARAQKLNFIPLATERYLLATRAAMLTQATMRNFCALLDSPEFVRALSKLPGYAAPATHAPQRVANLF